MTHCPYRRKEDNSDAVAAIDDGIAGIATAVADQSNHLDKYWTGTHSYRRSFVVVVVVDNAWLEINALFRLIFGCQYLAAVHRIPVSDDRSDMGPTERFGRLCDDLSADGDWVVYVRRFALNCWSNKTDVLIWIGTNAWRMWAECRRIIVCHDGFFDDRDSN